MPYIKGKLRQLIYESESNYKVGIIRVKETDDEELRDFLNKTITFVGYFASLNIDDNYKLEGTLIYNNKYGYQYKVNSYEREEIKGIDATYEFLCSPIIKGCGEKTAKDIVNTLGEDAIKLIKENISNLYLVPKMTEKKAIKIYESIINNLSIDDNMIELKKMGFTINESLSIINVYGSNAIKIVNNNIYELKDIVDFKKLDNIYLNSDNYNEDTRLFNVLYQVFKNLEFDLGSTYFKEEELIDGLKKYFNIIIDYDKYINILDSLIDAGIIYKEDSNYFLKETYDMEDYIANKLLYINSLSTKTYKAIETEIIKLQEELDFKYNDEQLNAIKYSLENRVSIITGGPGTGKTTIVKAIVNLYILLHNLSQREIISDIALLAPTGRAAKKLSESTGLGASTIHRYLKWNKESNEFQVNELNQTSHKLIIIDETSMIDTNLFYSLLCGLRRDVQIILVGDVNQLPSVGSGQILNDLIASSLFTYLPLYQIFRQSSNSYIPILASEIRNKNLASDFTTQKDDYNFLEVSSSNIKSSLRKIIENVKSKGLTERDVQILAPMYKGENGIDNLNIMLQEIFNPKRDGLKEVKLGDIIYRENDKVLQLVNDTDNLVFNGDIGYIKNIVTISHPRKSEIFQIDYDGNIVEYKKEDMFNIKHAYAMSIHKSQGSEFTHVIMPISKNYYRMLYNKLIYTGVSRAKKSLVLLGEATSFKMAVLNDYSETRNSGLYDKLMHKI